MMTRVLLGTSFIATFFSVGAARPRRVCDDAYGACHYMAVNAGAAVLLGVIAIIALVGAILIYSYEGEE